MHLKAICQGGARMKQAVYGAKATFGMMAWVQYAHTITHTPTTYNYTTHKYTNAYPKQLCMGACRARTLGSLTRDAMLPAMRAAFFLVSPVRSRRPLWMTGKMSACKQAEMRARTRKHIQHMLELLMSGCVQAEPRLHAQHTGGLRVKLAAARGSRQGPWAACAPVVVQNGLSWHRTDGDALETAQPGASGRSTPVNG